MLIVMTEQFSSYTSTDRDASPTGAFGAAYKPCGIIFTFRPFPIFYKSCPSVCEISIKDTVAAVLTLKDAAFYIWVNTLRKMKRINTEVCMHMK